MLDANMLPYPWHVLLLSTIGIIVCMVIAYYVLVVVWYLLKATLQAFIYQLWMYRKAKINGREIDPKRFWSTWRQAWFDLLGEDFKEPWIHKNSIFYGWTFVARKDNVFVESLNKVERVNDDRDEEEDIDDEDESDIVATYEQKDKK